MEKIVFEGTAEQLQLLKDEFKMIQIEHGEDKLPKLKEDYQTANLWTVGDVTGNYECDDETAMLILEEAMENEATISQVWESIEAAAYDHNVDRNGTPKLNY